MGNFASHPMRLTAKEAERVARMNPQQRDAYQAKKFGGYRASHPGKPRSYYQRPDVPKRLRLGRRSA